MTLDGAVIHSCGAEVHEDIGTIRRLLQSFLKETANRLDVTVDYRIRAEEFTTQRGGPIDYTEGRLIIDLVKRDSNELVWRGIYRDSEPRRNVFRNIRRGRNIRSSRGPQHWSRLGLGSAQK
jgi:hypothetical protein